MAITSEGSASLQGPPEAVDPALFREGYPWRITVDLNEACNIQCSYCHINALWGKAARDSRTLSPEVFADLAHDADQMQVFETTLTGGEITIMPDLDKYLATVHDLGFTSVQIITNGTRMSPQLAGELKDAGVRRVSISVDGPEGPNDQARGEGVWRRAWQGIENAVAAGLQVNVISVLGKHNIDTWQELPPMLKDAGVRSQNLSLMCRLGRAESAAEWQGVPEDRLEELRTSIKAAQRVMNNAAFTMFFNDGVLQEPGWSGEPTPLHAFQDRNPGIEAVVKVDGSVLRNRLYGRNRAIGNIAVTRMPELWDQDRARRAQLASVVGEANVDTLPRLYHHYEGQATTAQIDPVAPDARLGQSPDSMRVRHEAWGSITFDTSTFAITSITAAGGNQ